MKLKALRAIELWQQAGAYSVRIQGMGRQHHISLQNEFDEHDGPETKYIVILDGEYPVATCRFYETEANTVMLGRVVVLPEYRNIGIGTRTIQEAENWISELGYSTIKLESRVEKKGFYEKLGYSVETEKVIHGITFECISMVKKI